MVCLDGGNLYHYLRAARKYAASSNNSNCLFFLIYLNNIKLKLI